MLQLLSGCDHFRHLIQLVPVNTTCVLEGNADDTCFSIACDESKYIAIVSTCYGVFECCVSCWLRYVVSVRNESDARIQVVEHVITVPPLSRTVDVSWREKARNASSHSRHVGSSFVRFMCQKPMPKDWSSKSLCEATRTRFDQ